MRQDAFESAAIEMSETLAKVLEPIAKVGEVIAQELGFALTMGTAAGRETVEVGRCRVAGVIEAETVEGIAASGFDEAIARPLVYRGTTGAEPDTPLLVAGVERVPVDVLHRVLRIYIAAVTPQAEVAPDFDPGVARRFD